VRVCICLAVFLGRWIPECVPTRQNVKCLRRQKVFSDMCGQSLTHLPVGLAELRLESSNSMHEGVAMVTKTESDDDSGKMCCHVVLREHGQKQKDIYTLTHRYTHTQHTDTCIHTHTHTRAHTHTQKHTVSLTYTHTTHPPTHTHTHTHTVIEFNYSAADRCEAALVVHCVHQCSTLSAWLVQGAAQGFSVSELPALNNLPRDSDVFPSSPKRCLCRKKKK
jgi:hypothetical protein